MYVNEIMEQKDKKEQQEENTKVLKEKRKRGPKEGEELRRISPEKRKACDMKGFIIQLLLWSLHEG